MFSKMFEYTWILLIKATVKSMVDAFGYSFLITFFYVLTSILRKILLRFKMIKPTFLNTGIRPYLLLMMQIYVWFFFENTLQILSVYVL